jgi:nucleotide-binding universal stress UspA family protein
MYDRILVPTDGSAPAEKGANHAIELAASLGATIHALYVIDLPGVPRALSIRDDEAELRERYREYGEAVTEELRASAEEAGVDCVDATRTGSIRERVNDYAEEEDIDVIVMGTGYRGKVGMLLGGTAEKVVRTATIPITTVRLSEYERR